MGYAMAAEAAARGADVTLVSGYATLAAPEGVECRAGRQRGGDVPGLRRTFRGLRSVHRRRRGRRLHAGDRRPAEDQEVRGGRGGGDPDFAPAADDRTFSRRWPRANVRGRSSSGSPPRRRTCSPTRSPNCAAATWIWSSPTTSRRPARASTPTPTSSRCSGRTAARKPCRCWPKREVAAPSAHRPPASADRSAEPGPF